MRSRTRVAKRDERAALVHPLLHWDGAPGSVLPAVVDLTRGVVEEAGDDEELRAVLGDYAE